MRHINLEDSEVFNNFAKIAAEEGLLDKKIELIYPDYDISAKDYQLDLGITAMATRDSGLYGLKQESLESLVNVAHPGGGTTTDLSLKPSGDLAKVENIVEQHKKNKDIAVKKPTGKLAELAVKLVSLATKFEDAGMFSLARDLDVCLRKIAYEASESNTQFTDPRVALLSGVQTKINMIREQLGLLPIDVSGKMDAPFVAALKDFGIDMKQYPTMDALNAKIESVFQSLVNKQPSAEQVAENETREGVSDRLSKHIKDFSSKTTDSDLVSSCKVRKGTNSSYWQIRF
jgi:hypothetical protein